MKSLHTIAPMFEQAIAWFGTGLRCDHPYHQGYEHEREGISDHHDCGMAIFRSLGLLPDRARFCNCTLCYPSDDADIRRAHYFAENTRRQHLDSDGNLICDRCFAVFHPTPPEGTT